MKDPYKKEKGPLESLKETILLASFLLGLYGDSRGSI